MLFSKEFMNEHIASVKLNTPDKKAAENTVKLETCPLQLCP